MDLKTELIDQTTDGKNIKNFLTNIDKKGSNVQSLSYLKSRLSLLEAYWDSVFQRNRRLCLHDAELKKEKYFEEDWYAKIEEAYAETKGEVLDRIAAKEAPITPSSVAATSPVQLITTHSSLPKLSLPRFSGNQTEWGTFKERFSSMVRNDTTFSSVVKLQHLLSCLDDDAARRVKNLQIIGSNFAVAWEILTKRYDNNRVRLSAHMRRLSAP